MRHVVTIAAVAALAGVTALAHNLFGSGQRDGPVAASPAAIEAGITPTIVGFSAGDVPPRDSIHLIDRPGKYGLGPELPGSHYAIVSNTLVRVDASSFKILSVLRSHAEVLD
ncbi:hypothetical protein JJJ17_04940 [Paracoccus caeni]|uniref:Nickel/cobalt transporter regulator n=1 Tax=Paracoccus caeni TaxID=657651 RepID=A0A934VZG3_9RHOB|nr:hypothetical protein [Paracoccus caeni]MBK4215268.1 hypothetical protein [Paracoccus caeni]